MEFMEFSPPRPPPKHPPVKIPLSPDQKSERPVLELKPFSAVPHVSFNKVRLGTSKSCILYIHNPLDECQVVRVEKLPSDKGFSIDVKEFSIQPGDEKFVTIAWAPEKAISCRETVAFKSSSGCKSHAYLLGTAYSPPRKVIQKKIISTKSKRHQRKVNSPKVNKAPNVVRKNAFCFENFAVPEDTKENFDFLNSKSVPSVNFLEDSRSKFCVPEPRASFSLKFGNEFPDSPVRRQTYTINSMLSHGRESEILPIKSKECTDDSTWNKSDIHFNLGDSKMQNFQNTFSLSKISLPAPSIEAELLEENLDDSLENKNQNSFFIEIPCNISDVSSKISSKSDFPDHSKKESRLTFSKKHFEKKMQKSPFKAKVIKQKTQSAVDPIRKNSSVESKPSLGVKNREKPSKFLPKKLCLTKPRMTESVVYHRNPFASMNVYYDEHWIEKQEAAFTSWLNFVLTPNDDFSSEDIKVDSAKLWIESIKETSPAPAPTKEELSLKAYTALRNLNLLRKASFNLYQSEEIIQVIKKIEKEVDLKRISVRKDRAIYADLGIKKNVLEMLLSYNTLWLRIGLETVYGEVITLQSNSDVIGLSRFIIHRFLQNPEIASKFSHPAVINYYKKGYDDEIHRFILKKFLLLVFFLDTAKNVHLIKHNPCLFNKNSKYKSSRDLLLAFSREYLSGEGDVTKHLRYLGYKVSYQQTALEEFDFSVRNIATDLRCGLRLGRVVELLLQDWTVSQKLRINTLNRLTKIHNNDVILKALKKADVEIENNIEARHITDGDRERTLDLLWQIIFKTQIYKLINKDLLKKENAFLCRSLKLRADFAAYNALRNCNTTSDGPEMNFFESKLYKENEILQLLFQWCQNVCAHYNVKVYNFTSSFSDGRALCLLLHHYHPNILSQDSIKTETSNTYFEQQMKVAEANESCPFFMKNDQSDSLLEKLLKNERDNLTLVFQKFQEIGHIPVLSCPSDMSNTLPDEKVMITLVSYINIRLMELSIEIRAARKILHAWRQYKLRKQQEKLKVEIWAVTIIQKRWKKYLRKKKLEKESKAAILIQSYWRMYYAKRELVNMKNKKKLEWLTQNAIVIQAAYRGFSARKHLLKCHQSATVIQTYFRRWIAKTSYIKLRNTVLKMQQNYRAKIKGRIQRLHYLKMQENIVKLQAYARGLLTRRNIKKQHLSAVKIQTYVKMWLMKKKYNKIRNACIVIQQRFRGYLLAEFYCQEYQNYRSAAITIQRWYRNVKIQRYRVKCAIKIQSCVRRYITRKQYLVIRNNVIKIQTWWRAVLIGKKTHLQYFRYYRSIVCIQSFIRQCIASRKYNKQKQSAITIQKYVRSFIEKRKFCRLKTSTIYIQTLWRYKLLARKTRKSYLSFRKNVILSQAVIRSFLATKKFCQKRQAAIVIQKNFRMYIARKKFCHLKSSTICIQRKWKATVLGRQIRSSYLLYRKNVIFVQSVVRQQIAYRNFRIKKASAIVIQKYVRMFIARKQFLEMERSARCIQKWWKNYLFGCQIRKKFIMLRSAAVKIQSMYRMFQCRKNFRLLKKSVTIIELHVIGKRERESFVKMKKSTIKLQSLFKAYLCRKKYLKTVKSVILIQAFIRKCIAKNLYLKTKASTITIQKYYRAYKLMCLERNNYLRVKCGFVQLQALYRGRCVRKNMKLCNEKAVIIQKTYKRWKAQCHYKKMKEACLIVQQRYRAKLKMKRQLREYVKIRNYIIKIQAAIRGYLAYKKYKIIKESTIKIQSYIRMISCYKAYHRKQRAAVIIQRYYCSFKWMKKIRNDYLQTRSSVIFLQSIVRSMIARKRFLQCQSSVIKIQKYYRSYKLMCHERQNYMRIRGGFIRLQALYRGNCTRSKLQLLNQNATVIQTAYRKWKAESQFRKLKEACLIVQQRYQAKLKMKRQYHEYAKIKKAVVKIQALVRCYLAYKQYKMLKSSVIIIQSYSRMFMCHKTYCSMRKATIIIQQYYRSYKLMKMTQNDYLHTRSSVILLQSKVRAIIARREYLKTRASVIKIQMYYRSYKVMCTERQNYLKVKNGFTQLQALYRGRCLRKNLELLNHKSVIIQTAYRRWKAESEYKRLRNASLIIQERFRGKLQMKKQIQEYIKTRNSIVRFQALVRGYIVYKKYKLLKSSVIKIQSYVRMIRCYREYHNIQRAAVIIQRYYRSLRQMRSIQKDYFQTRSSVILLQSKVRSVIARKKFLEMRSSVIKIQMYYRSYKLMCKERNDYLVAKNGIVQLQALYRGKCDRKKLELLHEKAVIIQTAYRRWKVESQYTLLKLSAIKIQSYVRMIKCYKAYHNIQQAAIIIQRHYRSFRQMRSIQQDYFQTRSSVILLQSKVRSVIAQKKFLEMRSSVIKIQKYYRSYKLMCKERNDYLAAKNGIIQLQALYRGKCDRKKLKLLHAKAVIIQKAYRRWKVESQYTLLKSSAIKIQSYVRMVKCYKAYHNIQHAAIIIQRHYRSFKQMKKIQNDYLHMRSSVVFMQSRIRCKIAQRKFLKIRSSTVKIQRYYQSYKLMCSERENFLKVKCGIMHLQALCRGRYVRKNLELHHKKAVIIQKVYRRWKCESQYKQFKASAIKIQSYVRMIKCYKTYHNMKRATIVIQQHYRSFRQMKNVQRDYLQTRASVILLQSRIRSIIVQNRFLKLKTSVIKIQRCYRSYKLMCTERQNYMALKNGFVKLQALYRGRSVRKNKELLHKKAIIIQKVYRRWKAESHYKLLKLSVIKIQSYVRMIRYYKTYLSMQKSAIIIQRWYRSFRIMKRVQKDYLQTRSSAIFLQARVRMIIARKAYLKQKNACILIQCWIRMYFVQKDYNKIRNAAIIIQRHYHNWCIMKVERNSFINQKKAAICLQSKIRSVISRRKFLKIKYACIVIQSFARMVIYKTRYERLCNATLTIQRYYRRYKITAQQNQTALKQHKWYLSLRTSLIQFQRVARDYLMKRHNAAICIQSYFRMWRVLKEYRKVKAAIRIQACWRAYIVRRSITDKKVFEIRRKIQAADSTESQKLKNRTTRSLELLFKEAHMENILTALEHLDVCTQLSPNCCERLVKSGGLTVLIHLVHACNRSIPHMELIKLVANILLNLAKYEKTVNYVWEEQYSLETILHLMKIFREKGIDIFTKCCSLLWIFCQDPTKAEYMKEKVILTEQIRSFHYLLTRKQTIEAKRLVLKAIASSTFNSSSLSTTLNASVCQRSNNRNTLQIDPDWMLGKHRRREFKDPIVAITCVMKSLDLKGKRTTDVL